MKKIFLLFVLTTIFALSSQPGSRAQDAGPELVPQDQKDSETATDEEAKDAEQSIRELIQQRELDEAAKQLELAIENDSDNAGLHNLRDRLGQSYLVTRKYDQAYKQLQKSFAYRIANVDNATNQMQLMVTLSLLRIASVRVGEREAADVLVDRAIEAIDANDLGVASLQALSNLIPQKAVQLAGSGDLVGANQLLRERIDRIDSLDATGKMKESLVTAKSRLLSALGTLPEATEEVKSEIDEFITNAINEYPESQSILSEFSRIQSMFIARSYRSDPEAAMERLNRTVKILKTAVEEDSRLRGYLDRIRSYEPRIKAALQLKEMIGKPAPEFEIAAWVNQGDVTEESLKGKVVLLDFWSVWCGPCIATFPHLRDWYDEFHEQGFEIVGVTRYYGYTWDDESKSAKKSKDEVDAETENETLQKFLEHHELRHPTIVTPKDSSMQKAYGVTGIPHAVLIDRKGNVQMVKVGSSSLNAKLLQEKITELIAE